MKNPFAKILLGSDGSDDAEKAADMAARYGAELHVLHVFSLEIGLLPSPNPHPMPLPDGSIRIAATAGQQPAGK